MPLTSDAVNLSRGPPNTTILAPFSDSAVISSRKLLKEQTRKLLSNTSQHKNVIWITNAAHFATFQVVLSRLRSVLKPLDMEKCSFFEELKRMVLDTSPWGLYRRGHRSHISYT